MTPTPMTLENVILAVTSVVNAMVGWLQSFVQTVTDTPLLLIFIIVSLAFTGVALFRKLLRV